MFPLKTKFFIKIRRIFFLPIKYAYTRWQWYVNTPIVTAEWLLERRLKAEAEKIHAESIGDGNSMNIALGIINLIDEIHEREVE